MDLKVRFINNLSTLILSSSFYIIGATVGFNTLPVLRLIELSDHKKIIIISCSNCYHLSEFNTFILILKNNLALLFLILCGSVTLGMLTIINLYLNGFLFGHNVKIFSHYCNILTLASLILPHGIFEIPAIIIAGAAGFKIPL